MAGGCGECAVKEGRAQTPPCYLFCVGHIQGIGIRLVHTYRYPGHCYITGDQSLGARPPRSRAAMHGVEGHPTQATLQRHSFLELPLHLKCMAERQADYSHAFMRRNGAGRVQCVARAARAKQHTVRPGRPAGPALPPAADVRLQQLLHLLLGPSDFMSTGSIILPSCVRASRKGGGQLGVRHGFSQL